MAKCAHVFWTIAALMVLTPSAHAEAWRQLTLTVAGIDPARGGLLHVYVFDERGFPVDHSLALKSYAHAPDNTETSWILDVPADRPFALKVHHDQDGNHKITKNWLGLIPVEGLGFSAGAKLNFGPPAFSEAQMNWPISATAHIQMQYP